MNLQLLKWVFTARKRRRDYTQSAHTTGVNSDLAGVKLFQVHKSYPKMEQIEKRIKDFENDIGAHLEDKGTCFPETMFQIKDKCPELNTVTV